MTSGHSKPGTQCPSHPIEKVLVASALDDSSREVVGAGVAIAGATGASFRLIHAVELEALPPSVAPDVDRKALEASQREARRADLAEQVETLGLREVALDAIEVDTGPAHRVVIDAAARWGADLIVLGPTRHGHAPARFLGSTADRVLRRASCPVLVARGAFAIPPERVLLPVDLSGFSADAMRFAAGVLSRLTGTRPAEVETLFVVGPAHGVDVDPQRAADELASFTDGCGADFGSDALHRLRRGAPVREIAAEAAEWHADLIVLGTHGYAGVDRLLIGSVALGVAREAGCNVLLLPPDAVFGSDLASDVEAQTSPVW